MMDKVKVKGEKFFQSTMEKLDESKLKPILINVLMGGLICMLTVANFIKTLFMPMYRLFFASRHPVLVRTPEEKFISADLENLGYNFTSKYLELPGHGPEKPRMHFLDEFCGDDPHSAPQTVLCLHGEPTWSFLYRKMIPSMVNSGFRVIAPDFIGFGKSDKYVDANTYNHEFHMWCIRHLIEELHLGSNITLVCQDWGGLVGLSLVKDSPELFSNLVIMNTGLPIGMDQAELRAKPMEILERSLPFLVLRSAVSLFGTFLPLGPIFRFVVGFSPEITAAYTAPFPDPLYKGGMAKWPSLVPIFRDDPVAQHMVEARNCLKLWTKPVLVMFGDKDPITKGQEEIFMQLMPHAKKITIKGASHFLQETHGQQIAENVIRFLHK